MIAGTIVQAIANLDVTENAITAVMEHARAHVGELAKDGVQQLQKDVYDIRK
ncbi:MAG: hypothetical protein II854_04640 [Prevotella sp.]|nr:hypothetical protein [Prevotella sp.]